MLPNFEATKFTDVLNAAREVFDEAHIRVTVIAESKNYKSYADFANGINNSKTLTRLEVLQRLADKARNGKVLSSEQNTALREQISKRAEGILIERIEDKNNTIKEFTYLLQLLSKAYSKTDNIIDYAQYGTLKSKINSSVSKYLFGQIKVKKTVQELFKLRDEISGLPFTSLGIIEVGDWRALNDEIDLQIKGIRGEICILPDRQRPLD